MGGIFLGNKLFEAHACSESGTSFSAKWPALTARPGPLYQKEGDVRTDFTRDYTRILHCCAFRRLKHKTQVFFNINNDHVCTRMEHVFHVDSVSNTIADALGLNTDLTRAIALGHDLGHAPFGHQGESILNKLSQEHCQTSFWHEKNGLRVVDHLELLADLQNVSRNLNLTYAVRDGIISHCGEITSQSIFPRDELIDLATIQEANQYSPATWEACVVKMADKIAYIGRDLEDAERLGFFSDEEKEFLQNMARATGQGAINTTAIMHNLIIDICASSTPKNGICLSAEAHEQLKEVSAFSTRTIYNHPRLEPFKKYASLVLNQIFSFLFEQYYKEDTLPRLLKVNQGNSKLAASFVKWISSYCDPDFIKSSIAEPHLRAPEHLANEKIYGCLGSQALYAQAILDYISGMTDRYAIEAFDELITL